MRFYLTLFFCLGATLSCSPSLPKDSVLVKVGPHTLTTLDFTKKASEQLRAEDPLLIYKTLEFQKKFIVENFITESLLLIWGKEHKIPLPKKELQANIKKIKNSYPDSTSFTQTLAERNLNEKSWIQSVRKQLWLKRISAELFKVRGPIKEKEIRAYYKAKKSSFVRPEARLIRQVLVRTRGDAVRIRKQYLRTGNLKALVPYSIAPESKKGGIVGWIEKSQTGIFKNAFRMPVGRSSDVIESPHGYHIFEVVRVRSRRRLTYKKVRERIRLDILYKKKDKLMKDWIKTQLETTSVWINHGLIKNIQVVPRAQK